MGLRDRHRIATLNDLHRVAVELARAGGIEHATVEAITELVGVSRRTFFNYFPTKEDALLGTSTPSVPAEALERFRGHSGEDSFNETLLLVIAIVRTARQVDPRAGELKVLIKEFPVLRERLHQHVSAAEILVGSVLQERAATHGSGAPRDADASNALLMLASTVLRFAYTRDPEATTGPSPEAIDSAITLFRNVIQEIS